MWAATRMDRPLLLWHGFSQHEPGLAEGYCRCWPTPATLCWRPTLRGYGDSDKPFGTAGYDGPSFERRIPRLSSDGSVSAAANRLLLVGHDMGAPPALLWAADHPEEIAGLLYIEAPVMLSAVLTKVIAYTPRGHEGRIDVVVDSPR